MILKWQVSGQTPGGTAGIPLLRTVSIPLPPRRPCPSVRRTAPEPGTHGHIADGGGPESRLETHNRRLAA
jgi:hypothetical protein